MFTRTSRCVPLVAALVLVVLGSTGFGALMRVDVPSAQYEAYAATPRFQSVGYLFVHRPDGWWGGSAVLIAPNVLLTAGHNIVHSDIDQVAVRFGPNPYSNWFETAWASTWEVYPGYTASTPTGTGADLGVVMLSTSVTQVLPAERYRGTVSRGTLGHMAGFGIPADPVDGFWNDDDNMRGGSNMITKFGGDLGTVGVESQYMLAMFDYPGHSDLQPLEWGTTPGDSGCGWFADIDGRSQLIGINSFNRGDYGYVSQSAALKLEPYNLWIDSVIPEPATILLLVAVTPLLPIRRRKRCFV